MEEMFKPIGFIETDAQNEGTEGFGLRLINSEPSTRSGKPG